MGGKIVLYMCIIIALVAGDDSSDARVVETTQGPVRGYRDPDGGLFAYYSIPYATAPTGELKFKAPLPAPTWTEPLEAVDKGIMCPQSRIIGTIGPDYDRIQEDCLIANVFVPDTNETRLSVMVYVHGGAFLFGSGNQLTPKHLVRTQNVVVVTFNYRLGAHGFLCLGTNDVPGNAAMKDQVAALRWVKNNIVNFGGNPDDVTIAGYSAGASSVDLIAISKSATGLFSKVITESGSNLMAAFVVQDPLENARVFAAISGFTNVDDIEELEKFYKTAPYTLLTNDLSFTRANATVFFAPCIERETEEEAFLTDAPVNILKGNDYPRVPMLYGFAEMEGIFRESFFPLWSIQMNANFADFLPGDLQFESDQKKEAVAAEVKQFYFGDEPVNEGNILRYIDYFSDMMFKYPTLRTARMHVENGHNEVFLYEYSFVDDDVPVITHTDVRGATHTAQTFAVFDGVNDTVRHENNITDDFRKVKVSIRSLWANFAKTGSPVPAWSELPAWPAANAQLSPYLDIAQPLQLRGELLPEEVRFWDAIYERHYRLPVPPEPNSAVNFHKRLFNVYLFAVFIFGLRTVLNIF